MASLERAAWASVVLGTLFVLAGCGTPGAPQPPSLDLPGVVRDLSATRAGDRVKLNWTMPKRNTDRTMIKRDVPVRIYRNQVEGAACDPVGPDQMFTPGAAAEYTDTLSGMLSSSSARPIRYFVELRNRKGRSAGLSNAAIVLAGAAPAQIDGLQAEVLKQGVVLSWKKGEESGPVRLERQVLKPASKSEHGLLSLPPEPPTRNLLVAAGQQARAIDTTVRFGETYQYRAQRVMRVDVNGQKLELDGAFSSPVRVDVQDVFPPAVPGGLVAVASQGENGSGPSVDLSWQADTDPDLAGYIVYRSEDGVSWHRISPDAPIIAPAYHDATVQAGHTYVYAVTAADQSGHESARSVAAQETVPQM